MDVEEAIDEQEETPMDVEPSDQPQDAFIASAEAEPTAAVTEDVEAPPQEAETAELPPAEVEPEEAEVA
jgi:hypothetical protein